MKYFVVIDTNVLVSAMLKWDSIPGNILNLVFNNYLTPLYNDDIICEYRNVLQRKKFNFNKDIVDQIIDNISSNGIKIKEEKLEMNFIDQKDAVFYEVVMEKKKTDEAYLITGNMKHYPVKSFVVTPREMLNLIIRDIDNLKV